MKNKGITLLEMTIVLVIIAIVATAVLPNVISVFQDSDAELLRSIVSDTEMAVSEGIDRQFSVTDLRTTNLANVVKVVNKYSSEKITITAAGSGNINVIFYPGQGGKTKTAVLTIGTDGNVTITSCSGFSGYSCATGDLVKN